MISPVLQIQDLVIGYPGHNLSTPLQLSLEEGESLAILGPNGSGKSTFFKTLLGITSPLTGSFRWGPGVSFGFVPQEIELDPLFPLTLRDILTMGAKGNQGEKAFQNILEELEMKALDKKLFRDLSGGMKQRALLGRALIGKPNILLLDEPFNNLDYAFRKKLLGQMQQWEKNRKVTVLLIEHDINRILNEVDKMILLGPHQSFSGTKKELITQETLETAYEAPLHIHEEDGKLQIHFL